MIPMIDDFKQRFTLGDDFVVVADSGLMNKNNVKLLQQAGYKYILGARIRNETATSSNGFSHWTKGIMSAMNSSGPMANVLLSAIPKAGKERCLQSCPRHRTTEESLQERTRHQAAGKPQRLQQVP